MRNTGSYHVAYIVTVVVATLSAVWDSSNVDFVHGLVVPLSAAQPSLSLRGVRLPTVVVATNRTAANGINKRDNDHDTAIDLGGALADTGADERTLLVLGTHAADFNMVEYLQKIRASWTALRDDAGVTRCLVVVNGEARQCRALAAMLDLPAELELLADPTGIAGRAFGVSRGWRPDDDRFPSWFKVTVVGLGFGPPWGTLPAVLTGYLGNPGGRRDWIEETLKQGQLAGRWPAVLDLDESSDHGTIVGNKFDDFVLVSDWGRRPFELATMRLQNLVGIQIQHWDTLKPVNDCCLTQLGGCTVVGEGGAVLYSWIDQGLCDVPDMNRIVDTLSTKSA